MQDMLHLREDDPQEYHERMCVEGDGWSHGFDAVYYESNQEVASISTPMCGVLQCFTDENWQLMREEINRSTVLRYIDFDLADDAPIPYEEVYEFPWECILALFGGEQTHQFSQQFYRLRLRGIPLGGNAMVDILPFLRSMPTLGELQLTDSDLDDAGAMFISQALQSIRIEILNLRDNSIGDAGVEHLLAATNSRHLTMLCLAGNNFGRRGFEVISDFLGGDDCSLKALLFNCTDRDCVEMIINSIPSTSKLESLDLCGGGIHDELIQGMGVSAQVLVLGQSLFSFDGLCQSNHQLRHLGWSNTREVNARYPYVKIALETNARSRYGASIAERIRNKLRHFYFDGEYDVKPFAKMDVNIMPYALELVTKKEVCIGKVAGQPGSGTYHEIPGDNLNAVYWLIRNCHLPELFSFPSPESLLLQKEARIRELEEEIMALKRMNEMLMSGSNQL